VFLHPTQKTESVFFVFVLDSRCSNGYGDGVAITDFGQFLSCFDMSASHLSMNTLARCRHNPFVWLSDYPIQLGPSVKEQFAIVLVTCRPVLSARGVSQRGYGNYSMTASTNK
jgi:hypothetical protein